MHLVLVRHGEVDSSYSGVFYGGAEVPLSPQGKREAQAAGRFFQAQTPLAIFSSPLSRARYGAACVLGSCKMEGAVRLEDGLREIDRGRWAGLSPESLLAQYPDDLASHQADPWHWREHGGESLLDLKLRVLQVRDGILQEFGHASGLVVLVAHMFPLRAICAEVLGMDVDQWNQLVIPTGSLCWIDYAKPKPDLVFWGKRPAELAKFRFPQFS